MSENIKIIGIDCATEANKIGLSVGLYTDNKIFLQETRLGSNQIPVAKTIYNWFGVNENILIAIDAPLGWPINLGKALFSHNAGKVIDINANDLFRRDTDKFIKKTLGKQPLDVGADRIARTAHAALIIKNELEQLLGSKIELEWDDRIVNNISIIEVYPAATLSCYGIQSTGYKDKSQQNIRQQIIRRLSDYLIMENDFNILEENADALDSAVCLLAAKDFIDGNVYYPKNIDLAKKEGWIWIKRC